ncbi:MAG: COX15/CtaA family protein [Thermodesulfobacteriota bacterium]
MLGRATVGVLFLALVWGNLVAGLKAGLACPDWPLCHGSILPPWRWDIYMEFLHRVIAGAGAALLAALSFRRYRDYRGPARLVPALTLLLLALQIVMGGAVVLLEIPVQLTTVHFMAGILLFLLALYMAHFDGAFEPPDFSFRGSSALFFSLAALVYFQAGLGAYVRHLQAGRACPDFPRCLGEWIPSFTGAGVLAHYSHRLAGVMILLTALAICVYFLSDPIQRVNRGLGATFLFLVAAQIGIGWMVVLSELMFLAVAVHLATALGILWVLGRLWIGAIRAERNTLSLPPL